MAENIFDGVDSVDAELMERWLGGTSISLLSSKTLYDIQSLLRHYADIIVPDKSVSVEFPTEEDGNARASVDEGKIIIPTNLLIEGRVDDTIGATIHELHHIKLSDTESDIWLKCFEFVCIALDSIFVLDSNSEYISIYELVFGDTKVTYEDIFKPKSTSNPNPNSEFLRNACNDVAFLLNAVEDVRIDSLTPPNLKKYLDKMEDRIGGDFTWKYERGDFDDNTLLNIIFRLLFHHKGKIEDEFIEERFGDTDFIVNSTPTEYTKEVFSAFGEELRTHIEELFLGKTEPISPQGSEDEEYGMPTYGDDITERYLSSQAKETVAEMIRSNAKGDKKSAEESVKKVSFEDREINEKLKGRTTSAGEKFRQEHTTLKPPILSLEAVLEIDSYKNIRVHTTTEDLPDYNGDSSITYSCVIYDATV